MANKKMQQHLRDIRCAKIAGWRRITGDVGTFGANRRKVPFYSKSMDDALLLLKPLRKAGWERFSLHEMPYGEGWEFTAWHKDHGHLSGWGYFKDGGGAPCRAIVEAVLKTEKKETK